MWEDFTFGQRDSDDIRGELHRLNAAELKRLKRYNERPRWELLSELAVVDSVVYNHRRPEFLARLTDRQYIDLFHHLKGLSIHSYAFLNGLRS